MGKSSNRHKRNKKQKSDSVIAQKNEIRKKNPNVFHFTLDSSFIFESRHCTYFYNTLIDKNKMKPALLDIKFLKEYEKNYEVIYEENPNTKYIEVPLNIFNFFKSRKKISPILDDSDLKIKSLIQNIKIENFSCRKLSELYQKKFNINISKTKVNKILKYKLGLRFLKSNIKNSNILSFKSKEQSFFVLKILIRHLKMGGSIIYIDESTFYSKNSNLRCWRKNDCHIFKETKNNGKTYLILAITPKKVIHWVLSSANNESSDFKDFISETIDILTDLEKKELIFFMDNATIQSTLEVMKLFADNKLKVVYNTPYLSFFNMTELCFRSLKKVMYDNLFSSIEEVESKIIDILDSQKFQAQLPLLFKETLREYIKYLEDNFNYNLNFS